MGLSGKVLALLIKYKGLFQKNYTKEENVAMEKVSLQWHGKSSTISKFDGYKQHMRGWRDVSGVMIIHMLLLLMIQVQFTPPNWEAHNHP